MFIKRTRSKNFTYLSIAQTYREGGKVKHRIIASLGREDELKSNFILERLINSILKVGGIFPLLTVKLPNGKSDTDSGLLENIFEKNRQIWGPVKVYRKLWDELALGKILSEACCSSQRNFDISETTFLIVLSRLVNPSSKLKVYQRQEQYLGIGHTKLHQIYRALDHLALAKDKIETSLYEQQRDLFSLTIDVVFYDVTTLYFESAKSDELRNFGYSKDAKFGEVQVVVGLLVDREGRPVGFDVYPGNTFEGHTLKAALIKLKERFNIRQIIVVADRGINSKINLHAIKEMGYDYIVGSKLRCLPKAYHNKILCQEGYQPFSDSSNNSEEKSLYKIIDYDNKVVIVNEESGKKKQKTLKEIILCTWSPTRARKDYFDRDRLIKKAHDLVTFPAKIYTKKGARRFINTDYPENPIVDQNRINEDEKWDGYYGIQSSNTMLSPMQILDAYRTLWKIEESFRILKSTLQTRPIFHWTPTRITGHLVTCFIAFLVERNLEIKLRKNMIPAAPDLVREALNSLQISTLEFGQPAIKMYVPSEPSELAKEILEVLKIPIPIKGENKMPI